MSVPINNVFWVALGTLLFALTGPAKAQQAKIPVIGILVAGTTTSTEPNLEAFRGRLREPDTSKERIFRLCCGVQRGN